MTFFTRTALLAAITPAAFLAGAAEVPDFVYLDATRVRDGDVYADTWVATDALGRSLPTFADVGPPRKDRMVGLFYFLWVNQEFTNRQNRPVYDISRLLAEDAKEPKWGPVSAFHFWGEPELGYYTIDDPYVLACHRSLLTAAGIDVLILDQTNALVYPEQMLALCKSLDEGRQQGLPVPRIAGIHNSNPEHSVPKLYEALYAPKRYPELWFRWLGKPLLLAPPDPLTPQLRDFFTIRRTWAWSSVKSWFGDGRDRWTWVDNTPQQPGWHESPDKPEEISVCVAPHPINGKGRSASGGKDGTQPPPGQYRTAEGLYAAEQWQRALEVDPPFIFVTGWNEWIAQRFIWGEKAKPRWCGERKLGEGDTYFVDQYNHEFSRDIEPMRGGHGDSYYYQLVANVRRYKGVRPPVVPVAKPVAIDGAFSDWEGVLPEYRDFRGDTLHRDHHGWNKTLRFTDTTGRNDIIRAQVSPGPDVVAFRVTCAAELTPSTDPRWMQLFIDLDQDAKTGCLGHELMANRTPPNAAGLAVHRFKDGTWTEVGRARHAVKGPDLELALPRALFGAAKQLRFDFKWADNLQKDDDEQAFAEHGDSAPDRRYHYSYDQTVTEERIREWSGEAEVRRRPGQRASGTTGP